MAKQPPTISLVIEGKDEGDTAVYFTDFRSFCRAVAECLKRSEAIITGGSGGVRYRIADLSVGSAKMTLEAVRGETARGRDKSPQVVNLFKRTVAAIQSGKKVDNRLGMDDLQAFKKLASPLKRHCRSVRIDDTVLTPAYEQNADRILNDTIPTDGSVSGMLEKLNVHGRNEFVLFPPLPGYSIVCRFHDELLDQVRNAIRHHVTVAGKMHYASDSPYPRLVFVRTMDIHPNDDCLPTLSELRGVGAGCTGDMTAVEFVRSLRDD